MICPVREAVSRFGGQSTPLQKQKTEDGGQKTENREQKTESGGQKTEHPTSNIERRTADRGQKGNVESATPAYCLQGQAGE